MGANPRQQVHRAMKEQKIIFSHEFVVHQKIYFHYTNILSNILTAWTFLLLLVKVYNDYQFTVQDGGHCVPSVHILVTTLSGSTGPFRLLREGAHEGLRLW